MSAISLLQRSLDMNIPAVLWGPPGIGKTDRINQEAARREWPIETVIAAIRQPDDFAGLPWIREDGVVMVPPNWGKRLTNANGPSILFLDEISCAAPATQGALLRVVLERTVGDLQLPDSVRVVAAANPPEEAAGGWDLTKPLANRLLHITWTPPTTAEWSRWAMSPEANLVPHGASRVAAFLSRRPELLLQVPDSDTEGGQAWPSPRSWAMVAQLIDHGNINRETLLGVVTGCVGDGPAIEFADFDRDASQLPDPEDLLADPSAWKPDLKRLDLLFASLHAVVAVVVSNLTPDRWDAAWKLLEIAHEHAADIVFAVGYPLAEAGQRRSDLSTPLWLAGAAEALSEVRNAATT